MISSFFLLAVALLLWAYAGYPIFVGTVGSKILPRPRRTPGPLGRTWLLISAYNEEAVIARKLDNALALDDEGGLEVVVVSDGSTDGTDQITRAFAARDRRVRLVRVEGRLGKNHALNRALAELPVEPHDVVVFSDANASYRGDAVQHLRAALAAGAACAVGKLLFVDERTGTALAEGLYWRYENRLKAAEGRIGRLPIANGAIFAMRADEIPALPLGIGNDFWLPVTLLGSGRPVVYEPRAVALEPAPEHGREEFRRKVRMGNRSMVGVLESWRRIDAATRFQLVSHKVLRWVGLPIYGVALALGAMLALAHPVYLVATVFLAAPLVLALVGAVGRAMGKRVPLADIGVHFLLVHAAALLGVVEALRGKQRLTWEQARSARRVPV